jgi:nitrogen PTS system EIIA component
MMINDILTPELVMTEMTASSKGEALTELASILARGCRDVARDEIGKILLEREKLATTGVGDGVAIPHGKLAGVDGIKLAVGVSKGGVDFEAVDGASVHIFFCLLAPPDAGGDHLRALAKISRLLKSAEVRERLLGAQSAQEAYELIRAAEQE